MVFVFHQNSSICTMCSQTPPMECHLLVECHKQVSPISVDLVTLACDQSSEFDKLYLKVCIVFHWIAQCPVETIFFIRP